MERQPQKKPDASHKRTRTIALALLIAVAVLLLWVIWNNTNRARPSPGPSATSSGNAAVQTNEGGQVTIKVTWQGRSAGPIFTVEMDTHTVNLDSYDLRQLAVLRTDQGQQIQPSGWNAPPGGHHGLRNTCDRAKNTHAGADYPQCEWHSRKKLSMDTLKTDKTLSKRGMQFHPLVRPLLFGLCAALGLLIFYLGIITLAQGWGHALEQFGEDRWFVGAIMIGFGTQVGLFTYLRRMHLHATTGTVAASTGTSTMAMLACCAHHLTDVFAVLGLSGAAVLLNVYKTPLLWLGIGMNLFGIAYLLWKIRQQRGRLIHLQH